MDPSGEAGNNATSLAERARTIRDSVIGHVEGIAESGKAKVASHRAARHRDELLRELGELQVAAAASGAESPDQALVGRLVAEIMAIDAANDDDGDDADDGDDPGANDDSDDALT